MASALSWWLALAVVGAAALPITLTLFRFLPGRGYAFSRPLGLVLAGYAFWLLGHTGLLPNSRVGAILCLGLVAAASLAMAARRRAAIAAYFRRAWGLVLTIEAAWLAVFIVWGLIRSHTAGITHTEQPMDFALLNGILQSPRFPPQDPWFAGESISYYYGGYLMAAYVTHLSGVAPSVAYNLSLMSTAAMAAAAIMGLVYALVRGSGGSGRAGLLSGVLGLVLLLFIGNFEGVLEYLRVNGWGGDRFFSWLSIDGLTATASSDSWYPKDTWFWWRSSRVINTFVNGQGIDYTITEYPFFSFLLGDMHPHVMSLPFFLTGLAAAFNVLRSRRSPGFGWMKAAPWETAVLALLVGSLGFINSWDLPTTLGVMLGSMLLAVAAARSSGRPASYGQAVVVWLAVSAAAISLYLPFYADFSSQAGGILPLRRVMTRPVHFLIVLGPLLALNLALLAGVAWSAFGPALRRAGLRVLHQGAMLSTASLPLVDGGPVTAQAQRLGARRASSPYWLAALPLAPFVLWAVAELGMAAAGSNRLLPPGQDGSLRESVLAVWSRLWHVLPLMALISIPIAILVRLAAAGKRGTGLGFCLMFMGIAFLLAMGAELFHIADFFGNRMNTVFKFYYQQWVLLAAAGAFAFWYWTSHPVRPRETGRGLTAALVGLLGAVVLACFAFVPAAAWEKTQGFQGEATLDGLAFLRQQDPAEHAAVQWLLTNARQGDILLEGVPENNGQPSGDYDAAAARISQRTGLPTILGWPGHEHQWRGNPYDPITKRFDDVVTAYRTGDTQAVRAILHHYQVTYIVVGGLERRTYGPQVAERFADIGTPVFSLESVTIFQVRARA